MTRSEDLNAAARNRLWRRVDWRFLLPNPQPRHSICFAAGLLAEAVAMISEQRADPKHNPVGTCDLAVAVNPDATTLRAAHTALQAGGACYTEWHTPWVGGIQGIRQQLIAAGFSHSHTYWVWPSPQRAAPQFWLPLEAPHALRFFLTHRAPTRSRITQAARAIYPVLWFLALRARCIAPICAVAYKLTHDDAQGLKAGAYNAQDLLTTLQAHWKHWELGATPAQLSWYWLTGGLSHVNKLVGFVFADAEREPRLIVKMPRVAESIAALQREAATLRAVHGQRPDGIAGVPRVLFCEDIAGRLVLGESVHVGRPILSLLRRDNYRTWALKVTDWLIGLAVHTTPHPRHTGRHRLVEATLANFAQQFGAVIDPDLLHTTQASLETLGALPSVCEQRDCSPWNVLADTQDQLIVLDWESAEVEGLPALDLIYFLSYLAFCFDGAMDSHQFEESYRTQLDPTTFTGRVRLECLTHYSQQLGLSAQTLQALCVLVWLIHACSEYQRLATAGAPALDELRRSVFVRLWQIEARHPLRNTP